MSIARRLWECPVCGRRYRIPADAVDPGTCPECRTGQSVTSPRDHEIAASGPAVFIVSAVIAIIICLTLISFGVSASTMAIALGQALVAPLFAWFAYTSPGKTAIQQIQRSGQEFYTSIVEWQRRRVEEKRQRVIERQRRDAAEQQRRAEAERRRMEEIAKAMRPVDVAWESVRGVKADRAKTYGTGHQYVYCYSFPTKLQLAAQLKAACCPIKVGMASGHPIDRIREQVSASKTAMSESAEVLLIFRTNNCRHLERWLHEQLVRDKEALGREWFLTNRSELIEKFRTYVGQTMKVKNVSQTMNSTSVPVDLREEDFV